MKLIFNLGISSFVCIVLCLAYCVYAIRKARLDIKKGHYENYAQNVVTVGVLFTFVGVSISLFNFDIANIDKSISVFLDGMKAAFVTSIIGMLSGIFIKYSQVSQTNKAADQMNNFFNEVSLLKVQFLAYQEASIKKHQAMLNQLKSLDVHLQKNNMDDFNNSMSEFCNAVNSLVVATASSKDNMEKLSASMTSQAQLLSNLSNTLKENFETMVDRQENQMAQMNGMFEKSIGELANQINNMNDNIGSKISASGSEQAEKLNSMNELITVMKDSTIQSEAYSKEMLSKTLEFHKNSVENQNAQNSILQSNTESIVAMKDSFADFVNNVQKVFGEAVIDALNNSMNRLNDQLETQFGENFKHLNEAVKDVVKWQDNYKETVEMSVSELNNIDNTFRTFIDVVSKDVESRINSLDESLNKFSEVTDKNINVQVQLSESVVTTSKLIKELQVNMLKVEDILGGFREYADSVNKNVKKAIDEQSGVVVNTLKNLEDDVNKVHTDNLTLFNKMQSDSAASLQETQKAIQAASMRIADSTKDIANEIDLLQNSALDMTVNLESYVRHLEESTANIHKGISKTLEAFNNDFSKEAAKSVGNLESMFDQLAKETERQHEASVKTLASSLAAISGQMINNYKELVAKIEQLDRVLRVRGL